MQPNSPTAEILSQALALNLAISNRRREVQLIPPISSLFQLHSQLLAVGIEKVTVIMLSKEGQLEDQGQSAQEPKPQNFSKVKSDIPIEHWEKELIGKKMVRHDAPEDQICKDPPTPRYPDLQALRTPQPISAPPWRHNWR